jgi:hypothetical protein
MAFQVSPGVQVREIDLTNVVPAVSSSVGAAVGNFTWGPVGVATTITSEKDLAAVYGVPTATNAVDFFTAAYFLKYANNLKVVRSIDSAARNANSDDASTVVVIKSSDDYANQTFTGTITRTVTAAAAVGDTTISIDDATGLTIGDEISGAGVPAGVTIVAINGNDVTVSAAAIATINVGDVYSATVDKGNWIAKYPGALGNSIAVHVCPQSTNNTAFAGWAYKSNFTAAPGTSDYAAGIGQANDEFHIVVVDEDGAWTGTAGTVLETFGFASTLSDAKTNDGASNWYKNILATKSSYVWAGSTITLGSTVGSQSLSGGVDSGALGAGEIQTGFDVFEDSETIDVSLLIMPSAPQAIATTIANDLIAIAEARKDCVAFVSPYVTATSSSLTPKDDVIAFADTLTSSSYAVIDSTSLRVYDKYNDQYINIPASSSVAGLCANTDNVADAWFSPAGFTRGQLRGVTKVNFNPKKAERDELYLARVNPIATFPGEGTVLFGDKTAQAKPSAFDRINVRRLFIVLEKSIATAARYQLFEFNDEFTRAMFRNMVEPFLREVRGRRGITDFYVVCDETNNTGNIIDTNQFVADIYIKPARSINFISLNFIATRTGVEFSEIIGR